ncbi:DUF4145 domain-containing protein [Planctomicrobium sp. SH661]|uniref:DUF4145 domain-containing protein n=1 Tax=Planctomicrobium sp. SH661 TaxID=3448124 RepID=UPI003F5BD61E
MSTFISHCPHCGNTAPQEEYGRYHTCDDFETNALWTCYFFMKCLTCDRPLLYEAEHHSRLDPAETPFNAACSNTLQYPVMKGLAMCVPEKIRQRYSEAAKIKRLSPNGFANQIRRSLEAVCNDRGIKSTTLQKALQTLSDRGEIPDRLAEMTDVLRMLGNMGSHDSDDEVQPEFVHPIDQFFRAIVEYVYVARHNLDEFKRMLDAVGKK